MQRPHMPPRRSARRLVLHLRQGLVVHQPEVDAGDVGQPQAFPVEIELAIDRAVHDLEAQARAQRLALVEHAMLQAEFGDRAGDHGQRGLARNAA